MIGKLRSTLSLWLTRLRQESGSASVEFVILFPFFMIMFVSTFEVGLLMVRQVMLDRAVDMTVRSLRIGDWEDPTADAVKSAICDTAGILPGCEDNLRLNLNPISKETWEIDTDVTLCVDKTLEIQPAVKFKLGVQHEMMLVQVCALQEPIFPITGIGMRLRHVENQYYALMSQSAFVNEPS